MFYIIYVAASVKYSKYKRCCDYLLGKSNFFSVVEKQLKNSNIRIRTKITKDSCTKLKPLSVYVCLCTFQMRITFTFIVKISKLLLRTFRVFVKLFNGKEVNNRQGRLKFPKWVAHPGWWEQQRLHRSIGGIAGGGGGYQET